tara:strand:+ start:1811 stop:2260 length:450 start_codon:yes stop_codon:yes gene_type:complete
MAIELTTATTQQLSGIKEILRTPTLPDIFPTGKFYISGYNAAAPLNGSTAYAFGTIVNFKNCQHITGCLLVNNNFTTLLNVQDLINLEDIGTAVAVDVHNGALSQSAINQFFTDLPATNNTVTINVSNNPGAATCDATIATAKGYTVIV